MHSCDIISMTKNKKNRKWKIHYSLCWIFPLIRSKCKSNYIVTYMNWQLFTKNNTLYATCIYIPTYYRVQFCPIFAAFTYCRNAIVKLIGKLLHKYSYVTLTVITSEDLHAYWAVEKASKCVRIHFEIKLLGAKHCV